MARRLRGRGAVGLAVVLALVAAGTPAAAASLSIEKLSGNRGCRATVSPDENRGQPLTLVFTTTDGRDVALVPGGGGGRVEIVVNDRRGPFRPISAPRARAIRSEPLWKLIDGARVFHLSLRATDGSYRSSRFDGVDPDAVTRRLHARCPPGQDTAGAGERERELRLDGTSIKVLNWILLRDAGENIVPAQAPGRFDRRSRDLIERFSRRQTGTASRFLDRKLLAKLLAAGGFRFPPAFDAAGNFAGGVAAVRQGPLWGMISKRGRWVVRPKYDDMRGTSDGFMPVRRGSLWGIVDSMGRATHSTRYEEILACNFGRCPFRSGQRWGYLDPAGGVAIRARYTRINQFRDGMAAVLDNAGWALINRDGRTIRRFRAARLYSPSGGMLVFVDSAGKRGFYGIDGRVRVHARYDQAKAFAGGLGAVRLGDRWGFIDRKGRVAIAPRFRRVGQFGSNLAPAQADNGLWGYIDRRGGWAIEPQFLRGFSFRKGIAIVRAPNPLKPGATDSADLLRGFIDKRGRWIHRPVFEDVYIFREGLAPVKILGRWGYLDLGLLRRRR